MYLYLSLSFPCLTVANDDVDKVQAGLSARLGREGKTVMQNGGGQHTARPGLLKHNWANKRKQATTQTHLLHSYIFSFNRERGQKKTGLCGKNSQTGGGGLTQTNFLMSIVIFGMPKNCDFLVTTKNVPEVLK